MLPIVTFLHVDLAAKSCVREEGAGCLKPVFYRCSDWVRDEVDLRYSLHHHVWFCVKLYGCRRQIVAGDINEQRAAAACVLELLKTLNCAVRLLLCWVAGRLEQLNLNMQAQSVCSRSEILDVINSRLDLVIRPSEVSVGSSRQSQVYDD